MNQSYIEGKTFEGIDYTVNPIEKGEYDTCRFVNCNFANANLSDMSFTECEFAGCNLSMAIFTKTALKEVIFKGSKLLGIHFDKCSDFLFSVGFENCTLNLSTFYKVNLKKTKFLNVQIHEVDFSEADLTGAQFVNCDLTKSVFDRSILEKVDFRTSYNFAFDPEKNRIKKAKFSASGVIGLLQKYDIEIQ